MGSGRVCVVYGVRMCGGVAVRRSEGSTIVVKWLLDGALGAQYVLRRQVPSGELQDEFN